MKFIVTGGAGFIGHNVVRMLEQQGHTCYVIDSVTDYGFIPQDELQYLTQERRSRFRSSVQHVNICNFKETESVFKIFNNQVDAVIHLASFPRQKVVLDNPVWGSEVMSTALVNLLELTKKYNIPKFVYVSSSMVYGDFVDNVTEDSLCEPIGQYAIMKYMGEKLVEDYHRRGCFDYTIVRPSAVYGEFDVNDRVASKFMINALQGNPIVVKGAGEVLDFTHVEDTAQGIVLATIKGGNKVYNITRSNSVTVTLLDAAKLAVSIAESKSNIIVEDRDSNFPVRGRLNISRAQQDLGYNPSIDIEQGFKRYHDWFKDSVFWSQKTVR
jgi:nucleoside-diphosphate-sugar epimerase